MEETDRQGNKFVVAFHLLGKTFNGLRGPRTGIHEWSYLADLHLYNLIEFSLVLWLGTIGT